MKIEGCEACYYYGDCNAVAECPTEENGKMTIMLKDYVEDFLYPTSVEEAKATILCLMEDCSDDFTVAEKILDAELKKINPDMLTLLAASFSEYDNK